MFRGLNRLIVAAGISGVALTAVLAGPSAALACSGGTSAVAVYKECQQTGGGATPTGGPAGQATNPATNPASNSTPTFSVPIQKALSHAGNDRSALTNLVNTYGLRRQLQVSQAGHSTSPSAVGSAFDLGSGPTALLIALGGTAVLLLGGSGMRVWRSRRRI